MIVRWRAQMYLAYLRLRPVPQEAPHGR